MSKQTYWICSDAENKEFLESVGVVLGRREGNYWYGCQIPNESFNDLFEYWGSGKGDTVMFGLEDAPGIRAQRDWSAGNRKEGQVACSDCGCVLLEDGSCSLPLCRVGIYRKMGRKAAKLRQ